MPRAKRLDSVLLPLCLASSLAILFVACSDAPSADAGESTPDPSPPGASSTASPALSASSSKMPPLPDASVEGKLPRTYLGMNLGDSPPTNAKLLDDPPPFYPTASQYLVQLSDSPKTNVALYVHDGTIFRIEWRTKNASLDRDQVVEAFVERLGPPEEPSKYLPSQHPYWNDGLTEGSTTITVFRIGDSDWLRVAFEDYRAVHLLEL